MPRPTVMDPTTARTWSDRRLGRASSSFIAATGGIRAAFRAGNSAETTVTMSPTAMPTITVRGNRVSGPSGMLSPKAFMAAPRPIARSTPTPIPMTDATKPTIRASMTTIQVTCRPVAPIARRRANSFVLWATMMRNVLLMMNAPTKTATAANASSAMFRKPSPSEIASSCSSFDSSAVTTSISPLVVVEMFAASSSGVTPDSAATEIALNRPSRPKSRCASSRVNMASVAPARLSLSPKLAMPTRRNSSGAPMVSTVIVSPTERLFPLAELASITTSPAISGPRPFPSRIVTGLNERSIDHE